MDLDFDRCLSSLRGVSAASKHILSSEDPAVRIICRGFVWKKY